MIIWPRHDLRHKDESRSLPVYETPFGFKYIGELINESKIILGGEESAGLSIKGHDPEKDGILASLLAAEAVAARGASLTEQLNALYKKMVRRIRMAFTRELMKRLPEKLKYEGHWRSCRGKRTNRLDGRLAGWLMVADAAIGNGANCSNSCGIRISKGLGGAS